MRRPPGTAIRLLEAVLPPGERDDVVGDLVEVFLERVERRRRLNRLWFWSHAIVMAAIAALPRARGAAAERRAFMSCTLTALRQSARRLRADWRYSAAVLIILAVGIGPAGAMLSVVNRVLLRPLDYREPDRVGLLRIDLGQLRGHPGLSPAEVLDIRAAGLLASVEMEQRLTDVTLGTPPDLVSLKQIAMSTGMLSMLGVSPVLGRDFVASDVPPPAPGVAPPPGPPPPLPPQPALLDYTAWQTHFGGDPAVLGRTVAINGRATYVVGILPEGFRLVTGRAVPQRVDLYVPTPVVNFRNAWQFPTLARLEPGTTFAQVQAGLDTLSAALKRQDPDFYDGRLRFTIAPALDDITRTSRPALRAAAAAVLLLLAIALANATALVVARQRAAAHDFAIRSAIGASRAALVGQVLMESVLLAAGGAMLGACLSLVATAGIREVIPRTVPRWDQIAAGWDLAVYAAALGLGGLAVVGLVPIWTILRTAPWDTLRSGSAQGGRAEGAASRLVLVGAQIALTVVLAFGCAQLVRSAERLRHVDLGFDPGVLALRVPFDFRAFPSPRARAELYQHIRDRVREVPGVQSAGVVTHIPLSGSTMMDGYQADLSKETSFDQSANYQAVSAGYFATAGIPLLQGRDFTDQEDASSAPVVIVDASLVRAVFPGETNVLGRTLKLGWGLPNSQIVGVVGHAQTIEVGREVRPQIYAPIGTLGQPSALVTVRASGDPRQLVPAIEEAIRQAGPGRAISEVTLFADNVAAATSTLVAVTGLVTFLAVSAGALSAIGLYLVIAFIVHERRRATAIRTALGATRAQVIWHHVRTSGAVILAAVPVGVLLALGAAPYVSELVYGVGNRDVRSLAIAVAVAVAAGTIGTYVPVRRAADANIVKVLRES